MPVMMLYEAQEKKRKYQNEYALMKAIRHYADKGLKCLIVGFENLIQALSEKEMCAML